VRIAETNTRRRVSVVINDDGNSVVSWTDGGDLWASVEAAGGGFAAPREIAKVSGESSVSSTVAGANVTWAATAPDERPFAVDAHSDLFGLGAPAPLGSPFARATQVEADAQGDLVAFWQGFHRTPSSHAGLRPPYGRS
jgi:photosystem II stability/assembly factor-like uncharacterized protein